MRRILVVSSDPRAGERLDCALRGAGPGANEATVETVGPGLNVSELRADAVVVDLSDGEGALDLLARLRHENPSALLAALSGGLSQQIEMGAEQVGADLVLGSADSPDAAEELLRRLEPDPEPSARTNCRTIAFLSAKESNGASTAALHAAWATAAELERRTLLIDLDFHSGTLAERVRIEPEKTLADLAGPDALSEQRRREAVCRWRGLDILASPSSNADLRVRGLPPLDELLASLRLRYETIVLDLPTAQPSAVVPLAVAADRLYFVVTPETASLHLARRKLGRLRRAGVSDDALTVVVNRAGTNPALDDADVAAVLGAPIGRCLPNDYPSATAAAESGELVAADSALGAALYGLAWHAEGLERKTKGGIVKALKTLFAS